MLNLIIAFLGSRNNELVQSAVDVIASIWAAICCDPKFWAQCASFTNLIAQYLDEILKLLNSKDRIDDTVVLTNMQNFSCTPTEMLQVGIVLVRSAAQYADMDLNRLGITTNMDCLLAQYMTACIQFLDFSQFHKHDERLDGLHTHYLETLNKAFAFNDTAAWIRLGDKWLLNFINSPSPQYLSADVDKILTDYLMTRTVDYLQGDTADNSDRVSKYAYQELVSYITRTNKGNEGDDLLEEEMSDETLPPSKNKSHLLALRYYLSTVGDLQPPTPIEVFEDHSSNVRVAEIFELKAERNHGQIIVSGFHTSTSTDLFDYFDVMTDAQKVTMVRQFGILACETVGMMSNGYCCICDADDPPISSDRPFCEGYDFEKIFSYIIRSENFQQNMPLRLETIAALRRHLMSFTPRMHFDYEDPCAIVAWIIASIKSTSRELRIMAGRILPCFLSSDAEISQMNISGIFKLLSSLNFEVDGYLVETSIMAWAQIGKVCTGEQLNFVLIYLIRMLGSKQSFRSSAAFCSFQSLAAFKKRTCWQLCEPFWGTISVMVVKESKQKKNLLSRFSQLLGVHSDDFLARTVPYTVPYLVLGKNFEVLADVAIACNSSVKKVCLDHFPAIAAVLLVQDVENPLEFAQHRWFSIDKVFEEVSFSEVTSPNILRLSFELLKLNPMFPVDKRKRQRIINSLAYAASIKSGKKSKNPTKDIEKLFIESFILQLIALFSETVRNLRGRSSDATKQACLAGISLMMEISGLNFVNAVPQICTLLQSALEVDELQEHSMSVWAVMIDRLGGPRWKNIVNLTFSVVLQKWKDLSTKAREIARQMVKNMVEMNTDTIRALMVEYGLPSFSEIPSFSYVQQIIDSSAPEKPSLQILKNLLVRSGDENVYVVRQTLEELRRFLLKEQKLIDESLKNKENLNIIKDLMRTLFLRSHEFRESDLDISLLCSQCIGLVGAVDHHLVDISSKEEDLIVVNNFNGARESIDFVMLLLSKFLVRTFRASTDPSLQMFLAFGIQEFLKFCGFTTTSINSGTTGQLWYNLSYEDRSTLHSLLSTKYSAPAALPSNQTYPVFAVYRSSYAQWLQNFTYDLMSKVTGANAEKLFGLCRRIVRDKKQYGSMFSFILPYAALNVVVGGTSSQRQDILDEIMTVLGASSSDTIEIGSFHQSIFSLTDYFSKWIRSRKRYNLKLQQTHFKSKSSRAVNGNTDSDISIVEDLLSKVSPDLLALRSFDCKSYPRAIMYWEQEYRQEKRSNQGKMLERFERIYFALNDPDAHAGMLAMFPTTSIEMQLRQFENTNKWGQALQCYNAIMSKNETWDLPTETKALKCLKEDGRYSDLLTRLDEAKGDVCSDWISMGIEVSWLTGHWESLEKWLRRDSESNYEVGVGHALLALKSRRKDELEYWISNARDNLSNELSSVSEPHSLEQYGELLMRLHALADLESIGNLVFLTREEPIHSEISLLLDSRMKVCGNDYAARRYLLSLRRSAISISGLSFADQEVGLTWISSAKDARKQGQYALAFHSCLQAMIMPNLSLNSDCEYAELLWDQGEQRSAIQKVEAHIDANFRQGGQFPIERKISRREAEISLLYTYWLDTSGQLDSDSIISRYKGICRVASDWERPYYYLAKFYNKLEDAQNSLPYSVRNSESLDGLYVKLMVTNYARSLQVGTKFLFESLPKLITTWLNFAQTWERAPGAPVKGPSSHSSRRNEVLVHINNFLNKMVGKIPSFVFYIALTQLLSRITIDNSDVYQVMQNIILETGRTYPQQALWPIMGAFYSSQKERKERGEAIIQKLRKVLIQQNKHELLSSAVKFASEMILLCNFPPPERRFTVSLADLEFDRSTFPCSLVLPIASQMVAALPNNGENTTSFSAFSNDPLTIVGIEDEVVIQTSLQKPKRIKVQASNGKSYKILCKPKDDVRKDARLMEFTDSVDKLLAKDSEAYQRHLKINTYQVTPLNEDCGLIEWVDGAIPIRSIIQQNYSTKGVQINWMEAKSKLSTVGEAELLQNYRKLVDTYKPVLYEWFIDTFPEPSNWLSSRIKYARSCAVMSMVGYILGLGDRHGENLLLLENTGEVLHVDFDCLFDKGLSFEKPERVPFRLTHQMIDAMGITGYEGWFRRASEVTLTLLRENEDMLMNTLEAFLHDPIVDWTKKRRHTNRKLINGLSAARSPEEALSSIKRKIQGIKGTDPVALNVAGQVDYLIHQATSDANMSQMYVGWAAFL